MTTLDKQINDSKSLLETHINQQENELCNIFLEDNQPTPVSFKKSHVQIQDSLSSAVEKALPLLCRESDGDILEGNKPLKIRNKKVAVLFSGGPAAGGHNVVAGIKKALGENNTLYGVQSGPKGLIQGDLKELTDIDIQPVINQGGFDLLGSDRTKIKTEEQYQAVERTVKKFNLDGIIIIGGDDSNTNAALLAERLYKTKCKVIGVPKTIDGDLQVGSLLPISFGFDTATKIYSELVGNILQDTPSSQKYWHFVKLMGRSASHVTLEVALQTRPHITLISEEIQEKRISLEQLATDIALRIGYRAGKAMPYGVLLLPEGVIEFIPDLKDLIHLLNDLVAKSPSLNPKTVLEHLSESEEKVWSLLPLSIQHQLLGERDSHGNLQVSQIPTEELIMAITNSKIKEMQLKPEQYFSKGEFKLKSHEQSLFQSFSLKTNAHFFGYEGRCGAPSRFDAEYTYNLGFTAGSLVLDEMTGYIAAIKDIDKGGTPIAIPLSYLIQEERRSGTSVLVIEKALVQLHSPAFKYFEQNRDQWSKENLFWSPGPRQFDGPCANQLPLTVALNQDYEGLDFKLG